MFVRSDFRLEPDDLEQLDTLGISPEKFYRDLERFAMGFPPTEVDRPCTPGDGILQLSDEEVRRYLAAYEHASSGRPVTKFVPASGAATRMFRELLAARDERTLNPTAQDCLRQLERFAFYDALRLTLRERGFDLDGLRRSGTFETILDFLLFGRGLGYATVPKALLPFHRYPAGARTAFEEHLVEALQYSCDGRGVARAHFTISSEHSEAFHDRFQLVRSLYETNSRHLDVTFSNQLDSTQTPAVDERNTPIRDRRGRLVLRPAGHGALLENLNALQADVVFIKNIDNVVPDRLRETTVRYKKALAGLLITLEAQTHDALRALRQHPTSDQRRDLFRWAGEQLNLKAPAGLEQSPEGERWLIERLNRPLRVCGMVKNQGEPGGGPFWIRSRNGELSLQIVEKSQINLNDPAQQEALEASTHFNPVDLVCALRDVDGRPFDLMRYVDEEAGMTTVKSNDGKQIKALELPGLWNGSMAGWNTVFVEVPLSTFNPVKVLTDLLRPEHQ